MLRTEPARFRVVRQQLNHLWLEVLEGDDVGRRVSVPLYHEDYPQRVEQNLRDASAGDVLTVTLVREDENGPNWRVDELCSN